MPRPSAFLRALARCDSINGAKLRLVPSCVIESDSWAPPTNTPDVLSSPRRNRGSEVDVSVPRRGPRCFTLSTCCSTSLRILARSSSNSGATNWPSDLALGF
jgi:hypothetical protein